MSQYTSKLVLFVGLTVYTPLSLKPAVNSSKQSRAEEKINQSMKQEGSFTRFSANKTIDYHK